MGLEEEEEEEERRPPQPHGGGQKVREWRNGGRRNMRRRRRKDPPTTVLYCKICSYCVCVWRLTGERGHFLPLFRCSLRRRPPPRLRGRSTPARDTGNRPADVDRSHRQRRKESQPHWPPSSADDSRPHVIVVVMTAERRATSYRRAKKRRGPFFPTFPHNFLYGFFFLFGYASLAHCARRGTDKRSSEVRIFD